MSWKIWLFYGYGRDTENICKLCKYIYSNGKYNFSVHWEDDDKGNYYYDYEKPFLMKKKIHM